MIRYGKDVILYFDEQDAELAEQLLDVVLANLERLLCFFKLEELKDKVDIIIYSSIKDYEKHMIDCGQTYFDWMIADTIDGKINIANVDACRATQAHKDMSFDEYTKVIIHELVHICQRHVYENCYGCEWFWEALATNLSGQNMEYPKQICTKNDLMFHYNEVPYAYAISYHMGRYMLENLSHEKIYKYILNPDVLWQDTEELMKVLKLM